MLPKRELVPVTSRFLTRTFTGFLDLSKAQQFGEGSESITAVKHEKINTDRVKVEHRRAESSVEVRREEKMKANDWTRGGDGEQRRRRGSVPRQRSWVEEGTSLQKHAKKIWTKVEVLLIYWIKEKSKCTIGKTWMHLHVRRRILITDEGNLINSSEKG